MSFLFNWHIHRPGFSPTHLVLVHVVIQDLNFNCPILLNWYQKKSNLYTLVWTSSEPRAFGSHAVNSILLQTGKGWTAETDSKTRGLPETKINVCLTQPPRHFSRLTMIIQHNDSVRVLLHHTGQRKSYLLQKTQSVPNRSL